MAAYRILLLDTEPQTRNAYISIGIADALRRDPRVACVVIANHGDALARLHSEGLDTFIAFGGARRHTPLLTRLAALASLSILWTTEDPYEVDNNVQFSTAFDLVCTNESTVVDAYGGRAYHLPLAAAPIFQDLPVLRDDAQYRYDLLFIGTAWPNRVKSINAIFAEAPRQLKVKLALPYNVYIGPPALDDTSQLTDWRCGNTDFARFANRSRVVLTLPRVFSSASADRAGGTTPPPRLFETALAGGFQVMVSAEAETRDYYADGREIRLCASDDEAIEAIRDAITDPDRRIAMAEAAQVRTRAEHLYEHRVARMLDLAASMPSGRIAPPSLRTRKTVLCLSHNRAGYRSGGDIEVYQEALTELEPDYEILYLFPVFNDGTYALRLEGTTTRETFELGHPGDFVLTDPAIESVFERILFQYGVDLVHVQHLLHMPLSLPLIARACGVPTVFHLHDHYLICERPLLLDQFGRFCNVVGRGSQQCDGCLLAGNGFPAGSKTRRDLFLSHVVRGVDAFVTSTPFTGDYLRGFYPEIPAGKVVEIPMLTPGSERWPPRRKAEPRIGTRWLTVAVIGHLGHHEGAEAILTLFRLTQDYPIRFKLFGGISSDYRVHLDTLSRDRVALAGAYDQASIVDLLAGCDVSLHLSIWPETFVASLSEAWMAGLIPIVSNLGALGERVTDGVDGLVVPPDAPGDVMQHLLTLCFDRNRLERMRATVTAKRFDTPEAHLSVLRKLYARLITERPCTHDRVPGRTYTGYELTLSDAGIRTNARHWTSTEIAWDSAASGSALEPAPVQVALAETLPPEHAALPEHVLDLAALATQSNWFLDHLRIDGQPAERRSGGEVMLRTLDLRGWLRSIPGNAPAATYLRILGPGGIRYARLQREGREDLVRNDGDWASAETGFRGRIAVDTLSTGLHVFDLVQVIDGQRLASTHFLSLYVAPNLQSERLLRWQPAWSGAQPVPVPAAFGIVRQNLPEAAGPRLALPSDSWAFEAEIDLTGIDRAFALLSPEGGGTAWWLQAQAQDMERGTRVVFAAAMGSLPPGFYSLGLVVETADGNRSLATNTDVVLVPGPARARLAGSPPNHYRPRFPRRMKSGVRIDWAARVEAGGLKRPVRCLGWAFAPDYGAPLATFSTWDEGGKPRYAVSAALQRPDVAEHVNDPAARAAGFDLLIPEEAVRSGKVRLYQCYARRTVEFRMFQARLKAEIGPA